ncbi:MAG: molecular chaperone DnaJ [Methanosarcinaceae archaeon]
MSTKRDYYEILGISKDVSEAELKKTYRKLAMKFHPDKNKEADAEEKFKEISEAYAVLSDKEKRLEYDRYGHAGIDSHYSTEDIFRNADFGGGLGDIFDMLFGGGGGGGRHRRQGPMRGSDLRYDLSINLKDAAFGIKTNINVPRAENCDTCGGSGAKKGTSPKNCPTCHGSGQTNRVQNTPFGRIMTTATCNTCHGNGQVIESPCPACKGTGKIKRVRKISVKVPAGADNGIRLKVHGEGEAGSPGAPPGDLYVVIHVKPHDKLERVGDDIVCALPISFTQAALGASVMVNTLHGKVKMDVPKGTQTNSVFRLKGKGISHLHGYGQGDQHVRVIVKTPTKLTSEQKHLLEEFDKISNDNSKQSSKSGKGIFKKVKDAFEV